MFIVIYTLVWLGFSSILCLFAFFVGRCARRLPLIDDCLPWVLHRSLVTYSGDDRPPDASLCRKAGGHIQPSPGSQAPASPSQRHRPRRSRRRTGPPDRQHPEPMAAFRVPRHSTNP